MQHKECERCKKSFIPRRVSPGRKPQRFCSFFCWRGAETPEERFWKHVRKDGPNGCWIWTGFLNNWGYGQMWNGVTNVYSHRFSFELHGGTLSDGMLACHRCDNPACVNPEHLFSGTSEENSQDAKSKGRTVLGRGHRKLTEDDRNEIRQLSAAGVTKRKISARFGICPKTVRKHLCCS